MVLKFPDSADSADLAAAGYSQVIILGGGTDTVSTSATADYLLLAGGGGGGGLIAGGGGAGGYRTSWGTGDDGSGGNSGGLSALETALTLNNGIAYSITVGQGGEGGVGWGGTNNASYFAGHTGRSTSITGLGATVATIGGGGGRGYNYTGGSLHNGGSGGGGSLSQSGGTGTASEGFAGGSVTVDVGGGGGGAAAAGQGSSSTASAGDGGDGLASTITGVSITRAGGGGGGIRQSSGTDNGIGGNGGGGDGGVAGSNSTPPLPYGTVTSDRATHGRSKYGGGGGGAGYNTTGSSLVIGGSGGSGIAIFRLPSTLTYSASQLSSDVSSLSNCKASYLNTQVYTDDPNFEDVSLLIRGDTLTDLSANGHTLTASGNAAVDTGTYKYSSSGSLTFDGSGDYVSVPDDTSLELGSGNFTIECWAYHSGTLPIKATITGKRLNYNDYTPYLLNSGVNAGLGKMRFLASAGSNWDIIITDPDDFPVNQWVHVAATREGNTFTLWINGQSKATTTAAITLLDNSQPLTIGRGSVNTGGDLSDWKGNIEDFRITKGVARYTANFTPPSASLPEPATSTGGDHVISFTVATEDPYDGGATTNDGTATWTPTLSSTIPAAATTWTIPEGVDSFSIMAIGAGGAAGYSDSASAGGGGGGGGLAYLNNISVTQGNDTVQSITVGGGQLGFGGETDGGDGTDLTVTMNLATADPAMNLSGYTLNPYGQDSYDSSFEGIDRTVPLGAANLLSAGLEGAQNSFEIEADINYSYIKSLAETDPNTTNRWGYNPTTQAYNQDSYPFRSVDNTGRNSLDSSQYYDSDVVATFFLQNTWEEMYKAGVLGTFDSIDGGNGGFTLFRVFSTVNAAQFGALAGNSPYVDSNGQITISTTGDPYDFNGYGPQDLNQILIVKNLTP